ncbi:MAG: DUF1559 domain-containing protein [Pirellula sp.]
MSIRFECPNGHVLYAKDNQVGKTYACPKCGESVRVPEPQKPKIEVVSLPQKIEPKKPRWSRNRILLGALAGVLTIGLLGSIAMLLRISKKSQLVQQSASVASTPSNPQIASLDPETIKAKLRTIGIAWMNFESQTKRFIPIGQTQLSWRVHLLPYLEQGPLYARFKLDESWDSPHNLELVKYMPEVFSLSGSTGEGKTRIQTPVGPDMIFGNKIVPKFNTITDGDQNTLMAVVVGEDKATLWTKPDELQIKPEASIESLGRLPESFICGVTVAAQPVVFKSELSPFDFYAMLTPRGGEAVDPAKLGSVFNQSVSKEIPAVVSVEQLKIRRNKLRDVGMGILNYESALKCFPISMNSNYFDKDERPKLSWRVHLLPYLNQRTLYEKFKLDEAWDSPHNIQLLKNMPDFYRDPADPIESTKTRIVRLTGPETPFKETGPGPRNREFTDGREATLVLICCGPDKAVSWTKPEDIPFDSANPLAALGKIDGPVITGAFADNRVVSFDLGIPAEVFKTYVTHQGNEVIEPNSFLIAD